MITVGINGIGRIGKLFLWNAIATNSFDEIFINTGRPIGSSIYDIANYLLKDSSYGSLKSFIYGIEGRKIKKDIFEYVNEEKGIIRTANKTNLHFLRKHRNPKDIEWKNYNVDLVVDCTGRFLDPNLPASAEGGSARGHLESGAIKLLLSAPFKIKKGEKIPSDAITTVMGINDEKYDPEKHNIISNASCTTTCLSHMIKPIIDKLSIDSIISASMITVHAATSSQNVLDSVPKTGAKDLRKNRSFSGNIILTTTGAAKALILVIPEMTNKPFLTESVRIPSVSGSIVILNLCLNGEESKESINDIYKEASEKDKNDYLAYTESQNVSNDIVGSFNAAIIEASETSICTSKLTSGEIISNAVIYGWYDNEMGYVRMLFENALLIAKTL